MFPLCVLRVHVYPRLGLASSTKDAYDTDHLTLLVAIGDIELVYHDGDAADEHHRCDIS